MRLGCKCDRGLEFEDRRGVPYDRRVHCPACYAFWHNEGVNRARGGSGALGVSRVPRADACVYRGRATGETEECQTCRGRIAVPMYECAKLGGRCYTGGYTVDDATSCARCPHKTLSDPSDPKCGVVVGMYMWPKLAAMQIKLIRRTCGAKTPILITDDCSPDRETLDIICKMNGVELIRPDSRIGHVGGDALAFYHGLKWAKKRGLDVLAKLSQRMFLTRPRWLQEGAKELIASDLPIASRREDGVNHFPIRSEACLIRVDRWDPDLIRPIKYNPNNTFRISGEEVLIQAIPGGVFWPWSEIGDDRHVKRPHELNHWANGKQDYFDLAKELGVTLDPSFHADGWEKEHARGEYSFG